MRNVSDKVIEKIKTHILCSTIFFFEKFAVYEIMWENMKETEGPQVTIKYETCTLRAG
jgi:hypothetical protein